MFRSIERMRRLVDYMHQWYFLRKWEGLDDEGRTDVIMKDPNKPHNWTRREVKALLERSRHARCGIDKDV